MKEIKFLNNPKYGQHDIGTSQLFIDMFKDELVYCKKLGWYCWNDKYWQLDERDGGAINEKIKLMAKYCIKTVMETPDLESEKSTFLIKYYNKLLTKNYRDTIIKDSMSIAPVDVKIFNQHKYLFNCQNGTYDFKRKIFRDFEKEDYLTDISNVVYDENATCERFDQYLQEVMEKDETKIDYLLKIAAYCLTGDTSRECFFVLYGEKTRNGKSTFIDTISNMMGSYAKTISSASISKKSLNTGGSNATPEFAKLQNSRLVNVGEIEDGMMLDIALIKKLTGGNSLNARFLYKEEFEFIPQFKIIIDTNFLPRMSEDSIFASDRIHMVCFDRHFELEERDLHLKEKLKTETSGIFNKLIPYIDKLEKEGFVMPESIENVIKQYRYNSNNILLYMQDKLFEDKDSCEPFNEVFKNYTEWCEENGYNQMSKKTFKERLTRCGVKIDETVAQRTKGNGTKVLARGWIKGYSLTQKQQVQTQIELTPVDGEQLPF